MVVEYIPRNSRPDILRHSATCWARVVRDCVMCWCTSLRYLNYIQVSVFNPSVRIVQCWLGKLLDFPGSFLSAAIFRAAVWLGLHNVGVSHELLPWILNRCRLLSTLILVTFMFTFTFMLYTIVHTKIVHYIGGGSYPELEAMINALYEIIRNHDNPVFTANRASDLNTLEKTSRIWFVPSSWCRDFWSASARNVTTSAGTREMSQHPLLTHWNIPSFKHEWNVSRNARSSTRMWNRYFHPGWTTLSSFYSLSLLLRFSIPRAGSPLFGGTANQLSCL